LVSEAAKGGGTAIKEFETKTRGTSLQRAEDGKRKGESWGDLRWSSGKRSAVWEKNLIANEKLPIKNAERKKMP